MHVDARAARACRGAARAHTRRGRIIAPDRTIVGAARDRRGTRQFEVALQNGVHVARRPHHGVESHQWHAGRIVCLDRTSYSYDYYVHGLNCLPACLPNSTASDAILATMPTI